MMCLSGFRCLNGEKYVIKAYFKSQMRYCSNKTTNPNAVQNTKDKVKGYVVTRYLDHVKNYDTVLEKNFPSAMRVYRVFLEGVKDFYKDLKRFLKITRIANSSDDGIKVLTRSEMELYYQMPRDMIKVAPALFLSTLPVVGYAVFPLAYMYPRIFLTSHFWSLKEKSEFQQLYLKERLSNNRRVLRFLQAKLDAVKKEPLYKKWNHILGLLGSGLHPTSDEVLLIKDLFTKAPYSFNTLTSKHIKSLCYLHGLKSHWLRRKSLLERSEIIQNMDLAITREGGVHNMHPDALKYACFLRGLNPMNMSNELLIEWLRKWTNISIALNSNHISLFMHLPILIGYNHPNNWRLIHE